MELPSVCNHIFPETPSQKYTKSQITSDTQRKNKQHYQARRCLHPDSPIHEPMTAQEVDEHNVAKISMKGRARGIIPCVVHLVTFIPFSCFFIKILFFSLLQYAILPQIPLHDCFCQMTVLSSSLIATLTLSLCFLFLLCVHLRSVSFSCLLIP